MIYQQKLSTVYDSRGYEGWQLQLSCPKFGIRILRLMKDTLTRVMLGYAYPVSHTEITSLGWQLCKKVQCFYFSSEMIAHLTNKEGLKKNVSLDSPI